MANKGKENMHSKASTALKTLKRCRVDIDSEHNEPQDVTIEVPKTMTIKHMDYTITSMTQLVNWMALDKKHIATAQCQTAEAEQKQVEAEHVYKVARLVRVSKRLNCSKIWYITLHIFSCFTMLTKSQRQMTCIQLHLIYCPVYLSFSKSFQKYAGIYWVKAAIS